MLDYQFPDLSQWHVLHLLRWDHNGPLPCGKPDRQGVGLIHGLPNISDLYVIPWNDNWRDGLRECGRAVRETSDVQHLNDSISWILSLVGVLPEHLKPTRYVVSYRVRMRCKLCYQFCDDMRIGADPASGNGASYSYWVFQMCRLSSGGVRGIADPGES